MLILSLLVAIFYVAYFWIDLFSRKNIKLIKQFHPAWQVVHISRDGHILDIKVLPAICQLPGVDVVDHGAEGVGVHGVDVDLSLPLPSLQPSSEDWRLGAEETFVNSECL